MRAIDMVVQRSTRYNYLLQHLALRGAVNNYFFLPEQQTRWCMSESGLMESCERGMVGMCLLFYEPF